MQIKKIALAVACAAAAAASASAADIQIYGRVDSGLRYERKLFKTPISERWGKQICLNE